MSENNNGVLRIYACGGAGVNIGQQYYNAPRQVGMADVSVCFLDTSRSNLSGNIAAEDLFILPDLDSNSKDGSGKVRSENYAPIAAHIKQIAPKFKPADINIVLSSTTGGSGSVFGPLLAKELLAKGEVVVYIAIGSHESVITANNAIKTIKSLDNMAAKAELPIVMSYHNNRNNSNRRAVDAEIREVIAKLSILAYKDHHALDTSDVLHWAHYTKVTDMPPQLALLEIVSSVESVREIAYPISIASVSVGDTDIGSIGADYQTEGFFKEGHTVNNISELHYVISVNDVPSLVKMLEEEIRKLEEKREARPPVARITQKNDSAEDDGLVL